MTLLSWLNIINVKLTRGNRAMKSLNFCIDIDGTITEAYDWIPRANAYFKTNLSPQQVKVYDAHQALGVQIELYDEFYQLYAEAMYEEVRIRIDVKNVLDQVYQKHNIHFVTAREVEMRAVTEKWLTKHNIPMDTLTLLGSHDKVAKAKEFSCDLFIEDRYENAVQLSSYGFSVLLIDCHYNQGHLYPGITRVKDWTEINEQIRKTIAAAQIAPIAV